MKQDKTKPYQVCFLSTDDIVSKDKDCAEFLHNLESNNFELKKYKKNLVRYQM
jgi:hypothetical protein